MAWRRVTEWGLLACLVACGARNAETAARRGADATAAVGGGAASSSSDAGGRFENPSGMLVPKLTADGADDAGAQECGRQRFDVQRKPADILLVLDRSGSMKDDVKGDSSGMSKWNIVLPALQEVISATDASVDWGLQLFPLGKKAGECSMASYPNAIEVEVKPHNAANVNAAMMNATPDGDGTPTGDAVDEAVKYLQTLADGNPKYILLATDGEPSCTGTTKSSSKAATAAVDAVQHAADAGIPSFVVGIATTKDSANNTLTDLAKAGGQAPASGYYLASTKDELTSALQMITGSVATCRFPLSSAPPNPDHVGVMVGAQSVARDDSGKDGWRYADKSMSAIELSGPACDSVKSNGVQSVSVVFGCKSDPLF